MSESADRMNAADLLVHGTFVLRRAVDRLAWPVRHPALAKPLPEPTRKQGAEQRPTVGSGAGPRPASS